MTLLFHIDHEPALDVEYSDISAIGTAITRAVAAGYPEILGPDGDPHGLAMAIDNAPGNYLTRALAAAVSELWVACKLWIEPGSVTDAARQGNLFSDPTTSAQRMVLRVGGVGQQWFARLFDSGSGQNTDTAVLDEGRQIDLAYGIKLAAGGAGYHQIVVDGVLAASRTGLTNPGTIAGLLVGPSLGFTNVQLNLRVDEIRIGTSYADVQAPATTPTSDAPCPERTVIVSRKGDANSEAFAQYYAAQRGVPLANIVRVPCTATETLASYATFQSEVETPLATWLALNTAVAANVTTILLGYGVPGAFTVSGSNYSAASRLMRLGSAGSAGTANPLYDADASGVSASSRLTRSAIDAAGSGLAYLVGRIDADSLANAKLIVDRGVALDGATLAGEGFLDPYGLQGLPSSGYEAYEDLLESWGNSVHAQLLKQTLNKTATSDPGSNEVFGELAGDDWFFGWHSTTGSAGFFGTQGVGSRALFYDGDSYAMTTLRSTASSRWCPLALLSGGYALTAGPTDEPLVTALLAPAPLFEALRVGLTWIEAFTLANPKLDHMMTPAGDPLATVTFPIAGYHFYRGPNRPADVDYDTIIGAAPAGDLTLQLPALSWPASTKWWLAIKTVSSYGIESEPLLIPVRTDGGGTLLGPAPNPVAGLAATAVAGGAVRLTWAYDPADELAAPARFDVFLATGGGGQPAFDFGSPDAQVTATGGARSYAWTSDPQADGVVVRAVVRSVSADGDDDQSTDAATAIADATAPAAPPSIALEAS